MKISGVKPAHGILLNGGSSRARFSRPRPRKGVRCIPMRPYRFLRLSLFALVLLSACATSPPAPERQAASPTAPEAAAPALAQAALEATAVDAPPQPVTPAVLTPDALYGSAANRAAELAKKAAPLVNAFVNSNALFTRDGKQLLIASNRDGLPQLYVADASRPNSPARRLFEWKERVRLDATTPDGKAVLFGTDRGADEKWSLWRITLDGSGSVELTPGERMQRDGAHVADLAPDTVYYSARRMNEASSAVYAASTTGPGREREVYRDSKPGFLTDVSRDGRHGLFVRYPSRSENYLLLLDLASGVTRALYPGSGKVSIFAAKFSPDGRTIYVATDGGGEQAWLL